jgi:hypothetical protein
MSDSWQERGAVAGPRDAAPARYGGVIVHIVLEHELHARGRIDSAAHHCVRGAIVGLVLLSANVFAEEAATVSLDPIVVTATRHEERAFDIPASVE